MLYEYAIGRKEIASVFKTRIQKDYKYDVGLDLND